MKFHIKIKFKKTSKNNKLVKKINLRILINNNNMIKSCRKTLENFILMQNNKNLYRFYQYSKQNKSNLKYRKMIYKFYYL